ncbi:AsmA family protein [Shewanella sp. DW31]|uniref:AsmA family protein n=1 Tax=Shewanella sp. DW31 TaxID=2699422 RepID=UPI0018E2B0BE|nr:AsmA family protein [Shewanella sp. DW31]MBI1675737.1 AsmA family protein [Shewanella sp. DW31]
MKFIKWLLALMVTLILLVTVYLTVFFDPNDFKPEIVDAVKKQTGRELVITDDLSWTFFPVIGINLGGVSLSNPEGFTPKAMLEVKKAVAEVALMPLFSQKIEIAELSLDGATINLVTRKNGTSSFDGLSGDNSPKTASPAAAESSSNAKLNDINIGGISITNTQINMIDEANKQTQVFTLSSFTLGEFSLDKFAPIAFEFSATMPDMTVSSEAKGELKLSRDFKQLVINGLKIDTVVEGGSIPNKKLETSVSLATQIALDKQQLSVDIAQLTAASITAAGKVGVNYGTKIPQINADFQVGDIDLDTLLPKTEATAEQAPAANPQAVEPDLSALKQLDVKLKLTVKSIKVANLSTQNWLMDVGIKNGVLDLTKLNADLYQGQLLVSAQVDARQAVASYQFDKKVTGVQIRPLLKDAADVDLLAGTANFDVKGKGKSLIPEQLKKNLLANGHFDINDGALYGVNIPQMIRSAQAKLKGDLSPETKAERKTDFSSLTGSFSLDNGVATNPDLALSSPLLRLDGKGTANLLTEALDYRLTASLVNSLKGQGGSDKDALAGVDIPLAITGTFQKPEYALDTKALLNNQLKEETDKAKEKLKDSLLKKLGGF